MAILFLGVRAYSTGPGDKRASMSWYVDNSQSINVPLNNMTDIPGELQNAVSPLSAYAYRMDAASQQKQLVFGPILSVQVKIRRPTAQATSTATNYLFPGRVSLFCSATNYVYTFYARSINANTNIGNAPISQAYEYTNDILPFIVPDGGSFMTYVELDMIDTGGGVHLGSQSTNAVVTAFNYIHGIGSFGVGGAA